MINFYTSKDFSIFYMVADCLNLFVEYILVAMGEQK